MVIETILKSVLSYDTAAFRWCMARRHYSQIAQISRWISHTGDGGPYLLVALFAYYFDVVYGQAFLFALLLAFAIELPIYLLLKNSIKRLRPADALAGHSAYIKPSDKFSFPSGHTAAAFLVASLVSFYYPNFSLFAFAYAVLIGASRVLLGVHYPTDIAAGALLGMGSAALTLSYFV